MSFEYLSGDPALDLVNTVDWTSRGPEQERLAEPGDLVRWAEGAGVLRRGEAEALARAAARRPREAERALEQARLTRRVLHDLFAAVASGSPPEAELGRFNRLLSGALGRAAVVRTRPRGRPGFRWGWKELGERPEAVLAPVLWSAARLLTSTEVGRVRICGGPDCGWMYVDRSRNGLRRWCQMRTCGTREKSRRRREGITA
jgi:predicted RNA-binding Zn ribbon-like protein